MQEADDNLKKLNQESNDLAAANQKTQATLDLLAREKKAISTEESQTNADLTSVLTKQQNMNIANATADAKKLTDEALAIGTQQINEDLEAASEAADEAE